MIKKGIPHSEDVYLVFIDIERRKYRFRIGFGTLLVDTVNYEYSCKMLS